MRISLRRIAGSFNSRLREEATRCCSPSHYSHWRFNSRLREEATMGGFTRRGRLMVSTHASVRRRLSGRLC